MALSKQNRTKLYIWVTLVVAGGAVGVLYSLLIGGRPKFGLATGCAIAGGVMGFELFYVQQPAGAWLRRQALIVFIAISALAWTVIITAFLLIIPILLGETEAYPREFEASSFQQDLFVSLLVTIGLNALFRLSSLVGGRVMLNFLLGRYYRPLQEQRVFLFLDLANSTALAERLGDVRVQSLIGRFFFDIARPIADFGGETHRYIGDEIVVTWRMSEAVKDGRCVECVFAIQTLIAANAHRYEKKFGVVPQFRSGMHGGPVVASEVGDDKREIVYFGDTINTTARLQSLCKVKGADFLISGELLSKMRLSENTDAKPMGEVSLRGKAKTINIFGLSKQRNGSE